MKSGVPKQEMKIAYSKLPLSELLTVRKVGEGEGESKERDEFIAVKILADTAEPLIGAGARALLRSANMRWSGILPTGSSLATNGTVAKYLAVFGLTSGDFTCAALGSAGEYASITALFDEVFLHKVDFQYEPLQTLGGSLTNTTATNLQSCPMTWVALQHASANYSDASSAYYTFFQNPSAKYGRTDKVMRFQWVNVEKFAWDGPLGDSTTSLTSTGWMKNSLVATKLGGQVQVALTNLTGAAANSGTFLTNLTLGNVVIRYHVSFRVRA